VPAKSSILVGGVTWLTELSLLSLKKRTWSNPSIPEEKRFERRERTTTHCVAHKSKALGGPKRKKKTTNKYLPSIYQ
jgi:hypothetical protein